MTDGLTLEDIEPGQYADLMPDMDEEEFQGLKRSIKTNGYDPSEPIKVDADGNIVDGHHRYRACSELGVDPAIAVDEDPSIEEAIRVNLSRRSLSGDEKREVVVNYLENYRDEDETQAEVADKLGVAQSTISRACKNIRADNFTSEEKRQQAADYLDRNPDASSREIARNIEADVSHATIGNWREEWAAPPEEETDSVDEDATDATDTGESDLEEDDDEVDGGEHAEDDSVTTTKEPQEAVAAEPTPDAVPNGGDEDAGDPFRTAASEATSRSVQHVDELEAEVEDLREANDRLQQRADRQAARADELESLVREFVRAVENQDVEKMQATADRATEVL